MEGVGDDAALSALAPARVVEALLEERAQRRRERKDSAFAVLGGAGPLPEATGL